jgi:RNA polymerase sigma-70 factor (ECF subfamily)
MSEGTTVLIQQCLDRLEGGGERARGELIEAAGQRLARLAGKMFRAETRLRRWEDSGDVLHNAVLRLLHRLRNVTPATPRDFFHLAAGEIRRALIDLVRHHFGPRGPATRHDSNGWSESFDHPDGEQCPGDLAQWREFHERVGELPDDDRQAFELVWYQGLSYVEAAGVLGVSARTVTRRWQAACLKLQSSIDAGLPPF